MNELPTEEEMAKMNWNDLLAARKQAIANKDYERSKAISPYEHRAYARETVAESPSQFGSFNLLPFGYQAAKIVGLGASDPGTTRVSGDQLYHGLVGAYEGLDQATGGVAGNALNRLFGMFK